jgi:DNA-binding transcriptional LysR family regulator
LAIHLEEQALHIGQRMAIRIRADGFDGVIRMVARGAGLAIVPRMAIERWPQVQAVTTRSLPEDWANRTLKICARDFDRLPGYARALLEALTPRTP